MKKIPVKAKICYNCKFVRRKRIEDDVEYYCEIYGRNNSFCVDEDYGCEDWQWNNML